MHKPTTSVIPICREQQASLKMLEMLNSHDLPVMPEMCPRNTRNMRKKDAQNRCHVCDFLLEFAGYGSIAKISQNRRPDTGFYRSAIANTRIGDWLVKKFDSKIFVAAVLVFGLGCFAQTPTNTKSTRLDLNLECATKKYFRFRISNWTPYVVSIPTGQNYFAWKNVGGARKPKTATLATGESVFMLPDDSPINSILYFLERRINDSRRLSVETTVLGSDSHSTSWIDKNSSIFFLVDKIRITSADRIYVKFNYEWELNRNGVFPGGLNEHLAEFAVNASKDKMAMCK